MFSKKVACALIMCLSVFALFGCAGADKNVVRIHIRANSNLAVDQEVKLSVRDKIVEYITPLIADCENSSDVKSVLGKNLSNMIDIANSVLESSQFDYRATARTSNEYFPSRDYDGTTFDSGNYDALIIELGTGKGDNWWCVAYPPLCFVGSDGGNGVKYKSKLVELINKYFG